MKRNGEYLDAKQVWNGEVKCPSEILVFRLRVRGEGMLILKQMIPDLFSDMTNEGFRRYKIKTKIANFIE